MAAHSGPVQMPHYEESQVEDFVRSPVRHHSPKRERDGGPSPPPPPAEHDTKLSIGTVESPGPGHAQAIAGSVPGQLPPADTYGDGSGSLRQWRAPHKVCPAPPPDDPRRGLSPRYHGAQRRQDSNESPGLLLSPKSKPRNRSASMFHAMDSVPKMALEHSLSFLKERTDYGSYAYPMEHGGRPQEHSETAQRSFDGLAEAEAREFRMPKGGHTHPANSGGLSPPSTSNAPRVRTGCPIPPAGPGSPRPPPTGGRNSEHQQGEGAPTAPPESTKHQVRGHAHLSSSVLDSATAKAWRKSMQNLTSSSIDFDEALRKAEADRKITQRKQFQRECVLPPSSSIVSAWRLVLVPLVFWTVCLTPVELAVSWWKQPKWVQVLSTLVDVFFLLDMIFTVFVAQIKSGTLRISWRYRILTYLRTWFLIDFVSNFPWYAVIKGKETKSRKLVKLLKLPKVFRVIRLLRVFREGAHYFGTLYTLVGILLVVHYIACFWIWTLVDCRDAVTLWHLKTSNAYCPDPWPTYSQAVLLGIGTFRGVDSWTQFSAENQGEEPGEDEFATFRWKGEKGAELTVAMICLMCAVTLAVLFANVARSLGDQDESTRQFRRRLENLKRTEQQNGIDKGLYNRVSKHYHYLWSCGNQWGAEVLHDDSLTHDLRRELALSLYGQHLRTVPFLAGCDEVFLKQLCSCVELECFSPLDLIISAGEFGTDLYFLVIGQVTIQAPVTKEVLRTLVPGSFFGEMGLLVPDSHRVVDVVATTHGWMLSVGRESLQSMCSEELLETFCSVALERYLAQADRSGVEHAYTHGGFRSRRRVSQVSSAGGFSHSGGHGPPKRAMARGGAHLSHDARGADGLPSHASSDNLPLGLFELAHTFSKRFDKVEQRLSGLETVCKAIANGRRADEDSQDECHQPRSRTFSGTMGEPSVAS